MPGRTFGEERDDVTGELHSLHSSPGIIRMKPARHVGRAGRMQTGASGAKPEGNRPLGRPINKWEMPVKIEVGESGRGGMG